MSSFLAWSSMFVGVLVAVAACGDDDATTSTPDGGSGADAASSSGDAASAGDTGSTPQRDAAPTPDAAPPDATADAKVDAAPSTCLPNNSTIDVTNVGASAYVMGGVQNPGLTLCKGNTYTFAVATPGHPFWIKTAPITGTGSAFADGVTNNGEQNGNVIFAVPQAAPGTLHYICEFHGGMTGRITVVAP